MSLLVTKELASIFNNRDIEYINICNRVSRIKHGSKTYVQVYDTNLTKTLLESKKLRVFNYFEEGINHLKKKHNLDHVFIEKFWSESPLFINGPEHKKLKLSFLHEIKLLEEYLTNEQEKIISDLEIITYNNTSLSSSIDLIINHIFGLLLNKVSAIDFDACVLFLKKRESLFHSYFHTIKQMRMSNAVENFFNENKVQDLDHVKQLLTCSLALMGIDPIIGMLYSSITKPSLHNSVAETPTVGFITRVSSDKIRLLDEDYESGTIFNLSLVPNRAQYLKQDFSPINFGYATHKCLGIDLTKLIVKFALSTLNQFEYYKESKMSMNLSSEGTFLSYDFD